MTQARQKESQRKQKRTQVFPEEIRGLITMDQGNDQLPFLVWDVDEKGIGLWTSEALEPETQVVLTIGQPYLLVVKSQVVWCEKQTNEKGFRCGLKVVDSEKVFQSLIQAFLKSEGPSQ